MHLWQTLKWFPSSPSRFHLAALIASWLPKVPCATPAAPATAAAATSSTAKGGDSANRSAAGDARCYWTEEARGQQWLNLRETHHKIGAESRTFEEYLEESMLATHNRHNRMDKTNLQRRDAGIWPLPSISSIAHKTQLDLLTIPTSHAWRSGTELFTTINKAGLPWKLLEFIIISLFQDWKAWNASPEIQIALKIVRLTWCILCKPYRWTARCRITPFAPNSLATAVSARLFPFTYGPKMASTSVSRKRCSWWHLIFWTL